MLLRNEEMQLPIAVTMGDPAGIGPEIIARFFASGHGNRSVVVGDPQVMRHAFDRFGAQLRVVVVEGPEEAAAVAPGYVPLIASSHLAGDTAPGRIDARAGKAAYDAVTAAIDLARERRIAAIVTAPIHKEALAAAGIGFPGHTEILADRCGVTDFGMMLANEALRVVLVSIHVPLAEAIRRVTFDAVCRTIALAHDGTRAFGIEAPRIAVAGLNPHAGEGGLFGHEDRDIIAPAVDAMRAKGYSVSGPFAPDTVFMRARLGDFDVVVAQYHDQGLIPIKYMGLDEGVNITVGLPIIRTSVDHGTAFDIAGKGVASAKSLEAAYRTAERLVGAAGG